MGHKVAEGILLAPVVDGREDAWFDFLDVQRFTSLNLKIEIYP